MPQGSGKQGFSLSGGQLLIWESRASHLVAGSFSPPYRCFEQQARPAVGRAVTTAPANWPKHSHRHRAKPRAGGTCWTALSLRTGAGHDR
eukprot:5342153-Prymnesium_polylepis.1